PHAQPGDGADPRRPAGAGVGLGGRVRDAGRRQPREGPPAQAGAGTDPDGPRRGVLPGGNAVTAARSDAGRPDTGRPDTGHGVVHRLWAGLPRPLDPLRSIKVKFGVVVVVTACVAVLIVLWGYPLGFRARVTMPVGVLISLVVIQLPAHGTTEPLRERTASARQTARGDYSPRVRATSRDEVGELANAFNRMAADLAEVDRQRREFVANVSHELRTPISALRAVLENVADGVTPATPDVLESELHQTERLGRLVTQLLDLSRVEAGAAPLDAADLDVAAFVADVTAEA